MYLGFKYAGLQNNKQCYAGNTIDESDKVLDTYYCTMQCEYDINTTCGGELYNSIYELDMKSHAV